MFLLKKKDNKFENEVTKKIITPNECVVPVFYGDRFIPRRFSLNKCDKNLKHLKQNAAKDVLSLCYKKDYWRENTYVPTINFVIHLMQERILQLTDPFVKSSGLLVKTHQYANENCKISYDWPCKPRTKPCAFHFSTFNLPEHDNESDRNLVDWSVRDHLAISFGGDVKIWQKKENITMIFDVHNPRSLAYSPNGNFLAIGRLTFEYPVVELWDVSYSREFYLVSGKVFDVKHFSVQCIQWALSGKQIVCGTDSGYLLVLTVPELNIIKEILVHSLPLTIIRFSPDMRYFATADEKGNITIYNWNLCSVYVYVKSRRNQPVVLDWHPWTGQFVTTEIITAQKMPASIFILNVPSKKIVAHYQQQKLKIGIDCISFSKLTGELLVGIFKREGHVFSDYKILVLSSLDKIVDILQVSIGGVKFLMWKPDGTVVATTNYDEELCLWNFCSIEKTNFFKQIIRTTEKQPRTMESAYGNQFRKFNFLK